MRHSRLWQTLALAALFSASGVGAELFVVCSDEAPLFREKRQIAHLIRGEIVAGKTLPEDPDWLLVKSGDAVFSSRKASFKSEASLASLHEARVRAARKAIAALDKRRQADADRLLEYYAFRLRVERDKAIHYEVKPGSPAGVKGGPASEPKRTRKLSKAQEERALKTAKTEIAALAKRNRSAAAQRLKEKLAMAESAARLESLSRSCERFRSNPATYRFQPYTVADDLAQIFAGTKLAAEIRKGALILARTNKRSQDWLDVLHKGSCCSSPKKSFTSGEDQLLELAAEKARLRHVIHVTEGEKALLEERRDLCKTFQRELECSSGRRRGEFFPYIPAGAPDGKVGAYRVNPPPGAVEVVRRETAQRATKNWRDEAKKVRAEAARKDGLLDRTRRELALLEAREAALKRKLAQMAEALSKPKQ